MEIYKWIKGYEGRYEISNFGNVRSYKKHGVILQMVLCKMKGGYLRIKLNNKSKLIHRMVAETFIGDIPKGYEVNHIDFNPSNNNVDNLEICTPSENRRHTCKFGRAKMPNNNGERNGMAKLTTEDVRLIKTLIEIKIPQNKIAEMFGVRPQNISDIKCGKLWRTCG